MGVKYLYSHVSILCFQILLRLYFVLETAQVQRRLDSLLLQRHIFVRCWFISGFVFEIMLEHTVIEDSGTKTRRIEVCLSALFDRKETRLWLMVGRPRVITASRLSCSSRTLFLIWRWSTKDCSPYKLSCYWVMRCGTAIFLIWSYWAAYLFMAYIGSYLLTQHPNQKWDSLKQLPIACKPQLMTSGP